MSPHQTIAVAVRLFSIWLAIYVVRTAPQFFLQAEKYDDQMATAIASGVTLLVILVLMVLWFFPRTVAKGLLPGEAEPTKDNHTPERWFAVGCSFFGLWLLTEAVPGLIRYAIVLFLSRQMEPGTFVVTPNQHAGAIYCAIQFLISSWLLLGANGLRKLVSWARYAAQ